LTTYDGEYFRAVFGAGIAQGYATLGQIGFSERSGYTAIGTVCNVAARLCAEAKDGQILLSQRVNVALRGRIATEQVGALALKGLTQPVVAHNVPLVGSQAAFRVIEGRGAEHLKLTAMRSRRGAGSMTPLGHQRPKSLAARVTASVETGHYPVVAGAPRRVPHSDIDHHRRSQHPSCPGHPGAPAGLFGIGSG
jgi:hypothetical protein